MLAKHIEFPTWLPWFPPTLSRGEIVGIVLFLGLNLAVIASRMHRALGLSEKKLVYLKGESEEALRAFSFQALEVWAQSFGVLAIMNLGWYLMMPIARRSVIACSAHCT